MYLQVGEEEEQGLREVVLLLANTLKFDFQAVWRRCNSTWKQRIRSLPIHTLEREFSFLISFCGLRKIARLYVQIFRYAPISVILAGEYVRMRGLESTYPVRNLMRAYETLMGE